LVKEVPVWKSLAKKSWKPLQPEGQQFYIKKNYVKRYPGKFMKRLSFYYLVFIERNGHETPFIFPISDMNYESLSHIRVLQPISSSGQNVEISLFTRQQPC